VHRATNPCSVVTEGLRAHHLAQPVLLGLVSAAELLQSAHERALIRFRFFRFRARG
jgi:hypothetical protein